MPAFEAFISLVFTSGSLTTNFAGQVGNDTICCEHNNYNGIYKQVTIENVLGAEIRYGCFILKCLRAWIWIIKFELLIVLIKTEYFKIALWVLNIDDINCTNIDFSQDNYDMSLLHIGSQDRSASISNITSTDQLL